LLIRGNRALVVVSLVVFGVFGLRLGVLLRMGEKPDRPRPNATMCNERLFIRVIFCPQLKKSLVRDRKYLPAAAGAIPNAL
jgi:hypothetical protein